LVTFIVILVLVEEGEVPGEEGVEEEG